MCILCFCIQFFSYVSPQKTEVCVCATTAHIQDIDSTCLRYRNMYLAFLTPELVTVQISSGCWPVFSGFCSAVLLPYSHPRGKEPFSTCDLTRLTLSVQRLCWCQAKWHLLVSCMPLLHRQITVRWSAISMHAAENTKSHSANNIKGDILHLCSLEIHCSKNTKSCPIPVTARFVRKTPTKASKLKWHGKEQQERLWNASLKNTNRIFFLYINLWVNRKEAIWVAQILRGNSWEELWLLHETDRRRGVRLQMAFIFLAYLRSYDFPSLHRADQILWALPARID